VRDADVLPVIGERLGETTTSGYALLAAPVPRQAYRRFRTQLAPYSGAMG
jgi:hypothetical protein